MEYGTGKCLGRGLSFVLSRHSKIQCKIHGKPPAASCHVTLAYFHSFMLRTHHISIFIFLFVPSSQCPGRSFLLCLLPFAFSYYAHHPSLPPSPSPITLCMPNGAKFILNALNGPFLPCLLPTFRVPPSFPTPYLTIHPRSYLLSLTRPYCPSLSATLVGASFLSPPHFSFLDFISFILLFSHRTHCPY